MICSTPVHQVCNYAVSSQYCSAPDLEQIENGVIPLDSLPADWWNWMWADTNKAVNEARAGFTALINELESVLDGAGIVADCNCVNQVYRAIDKIRQTLATAATAGAVKSSSTNGNVTVNEDGTMTANGLGNVANISFGNVNSVVSGLNCLYTYTNDCFTSINGSISGLGNSKAPNFHADSTPIYGVGNAGCYGHVKLSDTYDEALEDQSGVAASQKAINNMYNQFVNGMAPLSDATPKAIGIATAGTSTCSARADHVHGYPALIKLCDAFEVMGVVFCEYCSTCYAYTAISISSLAGSVSYQVRNKCPFPIRASHINLEFDYLFASTYPGLPACFYPFTTCPSCCTCTYPNSNIGVQSIHSDRVFRLSQFIGASLGANIPYEEDDHGNTYNCLGGISMAPYMYCAGAYSESPYMAFSRYNKYQSVNTPRGSTYGRYVTISKCNTRMGMLGEGACIAPGECFYLTAFAMGLHQGSVLCKYTNKYANFGSSGQLSLGEALCHCDVWWDRIKETPLMIPYESNFDPFA